MKTKTSESKNPRSAVTTNDQIKAVDYIEMYVDDAQRTTQFYCTTMGFQLTAYHGKESGIKGHSSYLVEQGDIRVVLTSSASADDAVAEHVRLHGDSIKDIAFVVEDAEAAFEVAVMKGAIPIAEPSIIKDEGGAVVKATIAAFGDTVHTFVERHVYAGFFLPHFESLTPSALAEPVGFRAIDHIAVGVECGRLHEWVEFYRNVMSFSTVHEEVVDTEFSKMSSVVVGNDTQDIKIPIVASSSKHDDRHSQIEEYISHHRGPGAQHIAFLTDDIVDTVRRMKRNGIEFITIPDAYVYHLSDGTLAHLPHKIDALKDEGILIDNDEWGLLMQTFTRPMQARPTLFLEVIQRHGARGFGGGNIRALFEAVERDQTQRNAKDFM